jgi:2-oxoglutarate dehydrogenase E2 component (dihydrolipoamide succinyltransferase)
MLTIFCAGQTMSHVAETEVVLPKSSLTITEAVIIEWLVEPGQRVAAGDVLLSIETDKANQEIEAPVSGLVSSILKLAGETVLAGQPICVIAQDAGQARPLEVTGARTVAPAAAALAEMLGIDVASVAGTGPGGRVLEADVIAESARRGAAG